MRTIKIKLQIDGVDMITQFTEEEYNLVKDELLKHGKTPEAAVFNLLGL